MELNNESLKKQNIWETAGYTLPIYDREQVQKNTLKNPFWIHFGTGNIFRAFHANVVEQLLNKGILDRGLITVEGHDYEIIEKVNHPHDDLYILATLKTDGSVKKAVIGSVIASFLLDPEFHSDFSHLRKLFEHPSLQMATFTITEKGYKLMDENNIPFPAVAIDLKNGPTKPTSYLGKVTALLYARFLANEAPIALVSMDNCSQNGDKLYHAVTTFADQWSSSGLTKEGFSDYIKNSKKVSFPWTMIDKITPRPDATIENILSKDGLENFSPIITSKNTYTAPFVNAEECEYLVIEDSFPNGRPPLEQAGILFTSRQIVEKVEKMKVSTCLNPLHTTLAIFGCIFGYHLISEEMKDDVLRKLIEQIGYHEGLSVVENPEILDPKEFMDTVIKVRLPNPFMPDSPKRIATDTSQKLAVRFGETIKAYVASDTLDLSELKLIPLVLAGWLRYLMAIDDNGKPFELSPDPLLNTLCPYLSTIQLGDTINVEQVLKPILENESIFGLNLYDVGLAPRICGYFSELITGKGSVRATLEKYVS